MKMEPTIQAILKLIISNEGGYVNNPADAGGPTNMGITIPTLSLYLGRKASISDIINLTIDQAEEIYYRRYYLQPRFDSLPVSLQPIATDTGVLYGTRWAVQQLQKIVNQSGFGPIDVDGVLGPQSRAAIITAEASMGVFLVDALVQTRVNFSTQRGIDNPSQQQFVKGWTNRAMQFWVPLPEAK